MSNANDGGRAFPQPLTANDNTVHDELGQGGMSLRDYFAARAPAMPADLNELAKEHADVDNPDKTHREKSDVLLAIRAEWNYMYADAMIAARDGAK